MAVPRPLRRIVAHARSRLVVQVAGGGLVIALAVLALFAAMWSANDERTAAAADNRQAAHVVGEVDELQRLAVNLETSVRAAVVTGDPGYAAAALTARRRLPAARAALRRLVARHGLEAQAAAALEADVERFAAQVDAVRAEGRGRAARMGAAAYAAEGRRRIDRLAARFGAFREMERRLAAARDVRTEAAARRSTRIASLALIGGVALIGGLIVFLLLVVVRPVRRVTRAVDAMQRGHRDVTAQVRGHGDVARLAAGVDALNAALADQERRQAEAADALRASERAARDAEALFRAGFENAATGITAGTPDGGFIQVNRRMAELTGHSEEDLLEHGARLLWTEASARGALPALERLWSGEDERFQAERPYRHASGDELWLAVSGSCVRDAEGRPLFILAQFQDVTSRRQAERRVEETTAALQISQARYRAVVDAIDEVVFQASLTGRWRFLSPAYSRLTGIPVEQALGQSALDLVHPDDQDAHIEAHALLVLARDGRFAYEHRYLDAGGAVRWMAVEAQVTQDPETGGSVISGLMRDITDRRSAERAAREHVASLTAVAEVARTLPSGDDAREAIALAARRVSGASFAALFEPGDQALLATASTLDGVTLPSMALSDRSGTTTAFITGEPVFVADTTGSDQVDQRVAQGQGVASALFQPVIHEGRAIAVLAVAWTERVESLTEQQAAVIGLLAADAAVAIERADLLGRLEDLARTDALTGLPNRRVWGEHIATELSRARRHDYPVCVALLDIDHFKKLNDTRGHQAGDLLLAEAGRAWRDALRDVDLLARWGGEEFAVALPACDLDGALEVVERLRAAMPGGETCSAGIAQWDGEESSDAVLGRADAALYRAKDLGRNRAEVAAPGPPLAGAAS